MMVEKPFEGINFKYGKTIYIKNLYVGILTNTVTGV
jgi:hypothetical protein